MVACMIFVIFDHFFISFFTSDVSVASLAYTRLKIILPFQFLNMSIEVFSSVMRGVGYSSVPAGICVAGICGVRLAYLYTIYPSIASYDHLLIIYPISWFVTVLALALISFMYAQKFIIIKQQIKAAFLISTMRLFTFCMNIHKMQVR
jgi:Na+-driven multidrug efflux pump